MIIDLQAEKFTINISKISLRKYFIFYLNYEENNILKN